MKGSWSVLVLSRRLAMSVTLIDRRALRAEAALEPDPVHMGEVTKETQVIAIYGKGGSGKSFALSNLSYMMAQQGKRVLLIGCDPKSDTTSLLFGGKSCPTIIETSAKKKLAGEEVKIEDVCFTRDGVFAMELGGPEVGRGCGGRGIIHGFELLEKLGFHDWGFDYVLLDFLGDVVCGGFGLPIARDMCQKVIVVGSNDLQSLYVANNVCSAVEYFRKLGGNVGVAGILINKDDGTGEAQAFAEAVGIPVLASIPRQRGHPAQVRQLPDHRHAGRRMGFAVRRLGGERGRGAARAAETPDAGRSAWPVLARDHRRRLPADSRQARPTCAAVSSSKSRPSKSSTTRYSDEPGRRPSWFGRQPRRPASTGGDGSGCHGGADKMRAAAASAGKSEVLDQYAKDYPKGPHDQPQSMCPAFGSLRVGLRMRRTATVLSGSACCVYGLTFTSHFYGAKRTVGYVPFNSETLVTGKLFEDIREAVFKLADPALYDTIIVTNLCVPTASGVPLQLLPKEINGVRIIGIDVPGFGIPTHAEAKDVLAGAMLKYARTEAEQGPVTAPALQSDRPTITLLGEMFPADPVGIGMMLEPLGLAAGPVVPDPRVARALRSAGLRGGGGDPSFLHCLGARVSKPRAAASSARRRWGETARRLGSTPSAARAGSPSTRSTPPKTSSCPRSKSALGWCADQGPDHAERLRGVRASGRAPSGRKRRGRTLRRHRLPADAVVGP